MDVGNKVREFNRYYTNILGLLNKNILDSEFSLTEARVLFEIGNRVNCAANVLMRELNIDRGYMSRIINRFQKENLISRIQSNTDNRVLLLELTEKGLSVFNELNQSSNKQINNLLHSLTEEQKSKLSYHMECIVQILNKQQSTENIIIREAQIGDMGYIIHRHGIIYKKEYEFDSTFENYVLQGLANYIENYNSNLDCIWIAENNNYIVGSIAIVHIDSDTAQLRWFLVEPEFRNLGIGKMLVTQAIDFCKIRYKNVFLWTISSLDSARYLYKSIGFNLIEENSHIIWGKNLIEEKWHLEF